MENNNFELKPMNFGDVLDSTIVIIKNNFIKFFLMTVIFVFPIFITILIMNVFNKFFLLLLFSILFLIFYIITAKPLFESMLINIVYFGFVENKKISVKESFLKSIKKLESFVFNRILYYILVFVIVGCFYVLLSLIINSVLVFFSPITYFFTNRIEFTNDKLIIDLITGIIIGAASFLLASVFLYFYLRIIFCLHNIILEDYSSTESFSRSYLLTKGSYFHLMLSLNFLIIAILVCISLVFSSLWILLGINFMDIMSILRTSLILLLPIISTFSIVLYTVLYISLRIRNEGLDILIMIKRT
ncbi:MAG: hypothetical protein ABF289_07375 [Clostridiales bacterium]